MSKRGRKLKGKSKKSKLCCSDRPIVINVYIENKGKSSPKLKEILIFLTLWFFVIAVFTYAEIFRFVSENWDLIDPLQFTLILIFEICFLPFRVYKLLN